MIILLILDTNILKFEMLDPFIVSLSRKKLYVKKMHGILNSMLSHNLIGSKLYNSTIQLYSIHLEIKYFNV